MKPCISAGEKGLDAMVDPSFGRAPYFQFLDTETMTREVIENPAARGTGPRARAEAGGAAAVNRTEIQYRPQQ